MGYSQGIFDAVNKPEEQFEKVVNKFKRGKVDKEDEDMMKRQHDRAEHILKNILTGSKSYFRQLIAVRNREIHLKKLQQDNQNEDKSLELAKDTMDTSLLGVVTLEDLMVSIRNKHKKHTLPRFTD